MIIEVGGVIDDENKYHNQFCILSAKTLIEQNILKSNTCKGKKSVSVCPPDYARTHWSKSFWNNIPTELKEVKEIK